MHQLYIQAQDLFSSIIDVLLPRNARTMRTIKRKETDIPLFSASHHLLNIDITTLMDYRDPAVQDLIRSLKYDGAGHSAHICAMILADFLREEIAVGRSYSPRKVLLVPIPLHSARRRERGFDQIGVVLDRLPRELRDGTSATLSPHVLVRTKATKQQARLGRTERIRNVRDAFEVQDGVDVSTTRIFLIDDVTTTGATLASATKALREAGADVTPIALARA
jgi:ComF family protein